MQKFKTLDEINQLVKLLQSKPEIDAKVEYYKSVIKASDKLVKSIDEKLIIEKDDYTSAKLELEKIEAENQLFYNQQYFEIWISRTHDYDNRYKEIVAECEENYDSIISEGEFVCNHNPILSMLMTKHGELENVDSRLRVEFYLMVRQAVENYKKHHKINGILVNTDKVSNN